MEYLLHHLNTLDLGLISAVITFLAVVLKLNGVTRSLLNLALVILNIVVRLERDHKEALHAVKSDIVDIKYRLKRHKEVG